MKKQSILNLIKCHVEGNEVGFFNEAELIAKEFYQNGDEDLSEYIRGLLQKVNVLSPQIDLSSFSFLERGKTTNSDPLPLPECISKDVKGLIKATKSACGVNKFLFTGAPGTGKTETAKQVSRLLGRELYIVNSPNLIDSRLGQSPKNVAKLFYEINSFAHPERVLILFDEFDALAMERTSDHDLKEMGRVTTAVFRGFDSLDERVVIIATTNLADRFDKALLRRFDKVVDFSRYTLDDLLAISETILDHYLKKFPSSKRNARVFRKIISMMDPVQYPGDIKNAIKSSLAFSEDGNPYEYLSLLLKTLCPKISKDAKTLHDNGFSLRDIELITGTSKSKASRDLKEED